MTRMDKDLYPFFIVLFLSIVALVMFWSFLDIVIIAASLAVMLLPLHHRLLQYTRPTLSAVIITVCLMVLLAGAVYVTVMILQANSGLLANQIFETIRLWLENPTTHPGAFGVTISKDTLNVWLDKGDSLFVDYWTTIANNLLLNVFKGFVFFIAFFLLLLKGTAIRDRIYRHFPQSVKLYWDQLTPVTIDTLYVIYIVQIAIAVLTFFIAIPVFYLLGYGNVLFYSFLAALCEAIPILGSSVAFIIVGAYALAMGDLRGVLILFILGYIVVSALPEIFVRPVLVGRRVKIHPLIMFIGIIGGILTMGIAGFVLGPLIIVLLMKSYRIWTDDRRGRTGTANEDAARETSP
jgi:predicted PurR-regulated permease PerM